MPKGFVFWLIWILCALSFLGIFALSYGEKYGAVGSGAIVLVLTGLLGWQAFGKPIQ